MSRAIRSSFSRRAELAYDTRDALQIDMGVLPAKPRVTTGYTTHTRYTQSARVYRRGTQPDDAWEAAFSPAERRVLRVHGRATAEATDHVDLGIEPQPQQRVPKGRRKRQQIVPRRTLTCIASHRHRASLRIPWSSKCLVLTSESLPMPQASSRRAELAYDTRDALELS